MTTTLVRYRVKPEEAERNGELVRAVCAELAERRPEGIRYAAFTTAEDPRTFVHVARMEGETKLADLPAFRRFREGLDERVEWGPEIQPLDRLGDYAL